MSDPTRFRALLAQIDPTVGALEENAAKIAAAWRRAAAAGCDLLATPEMALLGYQPQDLVLRPSVVAACEAEMAKLATALADGPAALIGAPAAAGDGVSNAYWLLDRGDVRAVIRKRELPNNGVFDERRLYSVADIQGPVEIRGVRVGAPICEDAWFPEVAEAQAESGAEILIVPNGSPYARGKFEGPRLQTILARVVETGLPLAYVNLAGAQDDQVFDGGSFALDERGALRALAPFFDEADLVVEFERRRGAGWTVADGSKARVPGETESDYRAMVEGVRAYVRKNGFTEVLIGLSGGVDSALTAAIAADALGADNVRCVMLPSKYTSAESLEDAAETARLIGARLDEISIAGPVDAMEAALAPSFEGYAPDVTEENIQSRIRGNLLMALSNKTGALLLTTGNKSEVAVGYATLYGDMSGAYNPLKDLYKVRVFDACRWRNAHHVESFLGRAGRVIPDRVIDKPPSAELRPDQKDEDSLPAYEDLDRMLDGLIERDLSVAEVAQMYQFDVAEVARVERLVALSEYKRFQSAPGPKLSTRAFWLERRYPLTNRWRRRV